jgi:hypothetical protein
MAGPNVQKLLLTKTISILINVNDLDRWTYLYYNTIDPPYFSSSFDVMPTLNNKHEDFVVSNDRLPIGTIPIFATSSPEYQSSVSRMVLSANEVFSDFLRSEEGMGFCGQVCLIGDSMGSILGYDALCRDIKRSSSEGSVNESDNAYGSRLRSNSGNNGSVPSSPKLLAEDRHSTQSK